MSIMSLNFNRCLFPANKNVYMKPNLQARQALSFWTSDFQQKRIYKFQKIEHLDLTLFFPVDKVAQSIIYTQVLQAKSKHA